VPGSIAVAAIAVLCVLLNRHDEPPQRIVVINPAPSDKVPAPAATASTVEHSSDRAANAEVRQPDANISPVADRREPASREIKEIVAAVEPCVVMINVTTAETEGTGSGFLIDDSGLIVTNYHVIEGAKKATAVFHDKTTVDIVGFVAIDRGKDLALIRADCRRKIPKNFEISEKLPAQGDRALAFGAPLGFAGTVSEGIVSAIREGSEVQGYDPDAVWIQTTAPISHGNSGGPLVNGSGELIGVNTWTRKDGQSLNFAISATHVSKLLRAGYVHVRPLGELPPSRVDQQIADERARRKSAQEAARKAAETEAELSRFAARIDVVRGEVAEIEENGKALTNTRAQLFDQAAVIEAKAKDTSGAVAALLATLRSLPDSYDPKTLAQRQDAEARLTVLQQENRTYSDEYRALDVRARGLKAQIESLASERFNRLSEIRSLQINSY
jgi:hypothetical protein